MARVFRNTGLRIKLVVLLVIPSVALIWLLSGQALGRNAEAGQAARLGTFVQFSVRLGHLLHGKQKEGGLTAVFMSAPGAKMGTELRGPPAALGRRPGR